MFTPVFCESKSIEIQLSFRRVGVSAVEKGQTPTLPPSPSLGLRPSQREGDAACVPTLKNSITSNEYWRDIEYYKSDSQASESDYAT